jgi:hypothetical protein
MRSRPTHFHLLYRIGVASIASCMLMGCLEALFFVAMRCMRRNDISWTTTVHCCSQHET